MPQQGVWVVLRQWQQLRQCLWLHPLGLCLHRHQERHVLLPCHSTHTRTAVAAARHMVTGMVTAMGMGRSMRT